MQNPTDQAEAAPSIATDTTSINSGPSWNRAVAVRRKAAKRTHPFDLAVGELHLVPSSSPPQAEDVPSARKKPRLDEPLPAVTNEADAKTASVDVSVGLPPPPAADNDDANANADPVTDAQPSAAATRVIRHFRHWTSEEDAQLTSAVTNTSKKKYGKEYKTNWAAVASLVPSRTSSQCRGRWCKALDPSIDRATGHKGKWTAAETIKLKDAVQMHGGNNWRAIAALVPGRTEIQCNSRWHAILDTTVDPTTARAGKWSADEDMKLKNAAQTHGGKDWATVAALVPGRTKKQCRQRWHDSMAVNIDPMKARAGKWTADENIKLKDSVQTHGDKDWAVIAALITGRTNLQCRKRWKDALDSIIDPTTARSGKWSEDEDKNLKGAVLTHDGKDWDKIAALVSGRTMVQCRKRWHKFLKPNTVLASGHPDK
jgi:hypothetical protein